MRHRPISAIAATLLAATMACVSAGSLTVGSVPPGVQLSARLVERPISATALDSVRAALSLGGPATAAGRYPGMTLWKVSWTYQYERQPGHCALRQVVAKVEAEVHVPRWEPRGEVDSVAKEWWTGYSARLMEHERGHVRLAVDAGGEIVRAMRSLHGPSCGAVASQANLEGERILAELATRESAYDRDTHHGMQARRAGQRRGGRVPFHGGH